MKREVANFIRFCMDELIPPVIRDSKWFMMPFYYIAYRGKNIKQAMNFKQLVYSWNNQEITNFYKGLNSISRSRDTDTSGGGINFILRECTPEIRSVLDVGCGKGYLLNKIREQFQNISLYGTDIVHIPYPTQTYDFTLADTCNLPYADRQFDLVVCCHTIEHIPDPTNAIKELKRVCAKKLIIITPKQRYYFYTLDEHVNFFPQKEQLVQLINCQQNTCVQIDGDWVYMAVMEREAF